MRHHPHTRKTPDLPTILLGKTPPRTLLQKVDERDALHESAEMFRTTRVQLFPCSYPLAYEHVAEVLAERGIEVDPSCIWRWVQVYAPELNKRCRSFLKPTNRSYRTDETYIKVKGEDKYLYRAVDSAANH